MTENEIGKIVLDCSIELHRELGPGLLESVYEAIMAELLTSKGLLVKTQVDIPVMYKSLTFSKGFRADIVVENKVILELKSIEQITNVHKKQLLTYLKLSGFKLGYVLNFGSSLMKNGICRIVNGLED